MNQRDLANLQTNRCITLIHKVKHGLLDFDLLRPVDSQLLTSLSRVDLAALFGLPLPIGVVVYGLSLESSTPSWAQFALYAILVLVGTFTVYLINQLVTALCFWFTESGNMMMASEQLVQMGGRPVSLYPRLIRYGFAYVVPVMLCTTLSATVFRDGLSWVQILALGASVGFLFLLTRTQWKMGLRRYASASS